MGFSKDYIENVNTKVKLEVENLFIEASKKQDALKSSLLRKMSIKFNPQELNYGEACGEGTKYSMRRNPKVIVYGLGVDDPKGMYGTTKGLVEEFGQNRCFDTPLSEDAMTGIGVGMAINGFRPIHIHQRFDFLLLCMNQLINMAAKVKYLSNGKSNCPLIVRAIIGRSWVKERSTHNHFIVFYRQSQV